MNPSNVKRCHALRAAVAATWVMTVVGVAPVSAQEPMDEAERSELERAAALFEEAERAYNDGDLDRSVALLEEAYDLHPEPVLLYNLARAHEALGNIDEALVHYEAFLDAQPGTPDRGAIERRLATLREQIAARRREDAPPAETPPADPPESSSPFPPWVAGVGAVTLAGGAVVGAMALGRESDVEGAGSHRAADDALEDARALATVANVLFVAGGVLLAVGIGWWILDASAEERPVETAVGVGPGSVALRLRWR